MGEGVAQDGGAGGAVLLGVSQVHLRGGQIPQAAVLVLGVVPGEKGGAVGAGFVAVDEAAGEACVVFQRLEQRLAEGVVVADPRTAVGLPDAALLQKRGQRVAGHDAAAVGVQRQLPGDNGLPLEGLLHELAGQGRRLLFLHHPADDVAAVDVLDGVQVDVSAADERQPADVPAPQRFGTVGAQLGPRVATTLRLGAALFDLGVLGQNPVHRSLAAQVALLVEQRGDDMRRRPVHEARRMQGGKDLLSLGGRQGTRMGALAFGLRRTSPPVVRRGGKSQRRARLPNAEAAALRFDQRHQHTSSRSSVMSAPSRQEIFF